MVQSWPECQSVVEADFPRQLSGFKCVKPAVKSGPLSPRELLTCSCLRQKRAEGGGGWAREGEEVKELGGKGMTDGGREREGQWERNWMKQRDWSIEKEWAGEMWRSRRMCDEWRNDRCDERGNWGWREADGSSWHYTGVCICVCVCVCVCMCGYPLFLILPSYVFVELMIML